MIRCWRLTKRRYAHDALSGEGARLYGGRWNPRGVALVYTSGSQSLAILELLVHLDLEQVPPDMVAIPIDIPDSLAMDTLEPESLPGDWRRYPAPAALARLGADWAESGHAAVLRVPSALVPEEWNYLLSPSHP
ncbi:MAG: RES family NAD+ phosphorylase, partial [Dehalococcoidia bacterium]